MDRGCLTRWAAATDTRFDRASPTDLAFLAMDTAEVGTQMGIVLVLDGPPLSASEVRQLLGVRADRVPRLRQRLAETGFGQGRAVWADDPGFDVDGHVAEAANEAGGWDGLLDIAVKAVACPLPRNRPLWSATVVPGGHSGGTGVVLTLHHVVADGVTGLNVLTQLLDDPPETDGTPPDRFPVPRPSPRALATDEARRWLTGPLRWPRWIGQWRASFTAAGGWRSPRAAPCSLLQPTGARRLLLTVLVPRAPLAAAAHTVGATVNDALVVSVANALHRLVNSRGELLDEVAIVLPVSGHSAESSEVQGNHVSPLLVRVPMGVPRAQQLRGVARDVRNKRRTATGPPPIAVLGGTFRLLARVGAYRWYMNHQHRLHTVVSHVRGPEQRVWFGGRQVRHIIPVAVGSGGNVTIAFEAVSYAGALAVTVVLDPDHCRDARSVAALLGAELRGYRPDPVGAPLPRPQHVTAQAATASARCPDQRATSAPRDVGAGQP